jgi:hypothetical protein
MRTLFGSRSTPLTPSTSPEGKVAKMKAANRRQQALARRFEELVPKLIPEAIGRKPEGCEQGLRGRDFHRIPASVEYQNNIQLQYGSTGSDADFELRFP